MCNIPGPKKTDFCGQNKKTIETFGSAKPTNPPDETPEPPGC